MSVVPNTLGRRPPFGGRFPRHRSRVIVSLVTLTLSWSCGGGATDVPEMVEGREAFVGAYLDLRMSAVNSGSSVIEDGVRDSILALHGVTEQDLLDFIETHGEDVEFMRDLWTELEGLITDRIERSAMDAEDEENQ